MCSFILLKMQLCFAPDCVIEFEHQETVTVKRIDETDNGLEGEKELSSLIEKESDSLIETFQ